MRCAVLLLAALPLLSLAAAPEDEAPGPPGKKPRKEITCSGEAGFRGWYRRGGWVPVAVRLKNTTEDDATLRISASVAYGEGGAGGSFSRELDLPKGGLKQAILYVRTAQPFFNDLLQVQCRYAGTGGLACAADLPARAVDEEGSFLVVIGSCGLPGLKGASPRDVAVGVEGGELPDRPEGYDGVDWVVLRGAAWTQDPVREEALVQWLEGGGRVAVAGAEALHALAASSLGRRLGMTLGPPQRVSGVKDLQVLAEEDLSLPSAGALLCERASCRGVRAVLSSEGVPLLQRAGVGAGELLLFGVDPEIFRGQPGYWGLWRQALGLKPEKAPEHDPGLMEMPGLPWAQAVLGSPLFHREPIRLDWIWGFLVAYLLAVALLDYLLVRALHRWRLAGLVTLAVWTVSACAVCYALGSSGGFAHSIVSRVGVLDAFPAQDRVLGRTLASLYESGNGVYDVAPPWGRGSTAAVLDPAHLDTSGLALGESLTWEEDARGLRLRGTQVYVGTQKIFESRWVGPWGSLGLALLPSGGGWRIENHSKGTLLDAVSGRRIPPGTAEELGPARALVRPSPAPGMSPVQQRLAGWMAEPPPPGLPIRFAPSEGQRGFSFWMEAGVPLGIEGARPVETKEAILLLLHTD